MSASSPDEAERNRGYHAAWSSIAASVYRVATYFFTVTLRDRRKDWLTAHVDLLRSVIGDVRRERPFAIDAAVVLPDHLHAIITLPAGDSDYSGRWRAIKAASAGPWRRRVFQLDLADPGRRSRRSRR